MLARRQNTRLRPNKKVQGSEAEELLRDREGNGQSAEGEPESGGGVLGPGPEGKWRRVRDAGGETRIKAGLK